MQWSVTGPTVRTMLLGYIEITGWQAWVAGHKMDSNPPSLSITLQLEKEIQ